MVEDIKKGERIKEYEIEGFMDGKWKQVADGSCIGHKRIQIFEKPIILTKIRLKIRKSIAEPHIKRFQVFSEESAN